MAATGAGAAAGGVLGWTGAAVPAHARLAVGSVLALVGVALGIVALAGARPPLQCDRETPQRWVHRGPAFGAVMNGIWLGVGALTRLGFHLWYAIPAACWLVGRPGLGALTYALYGATRAAGAGVILAFSRAKGSDEVRAWLLLHRDAAHTACGAILTTLSVTSVLVVGL